MYRATGCHVFAGGFTIGVKRVFDVTCQLETHGFGKETCEQVAKTHFVNDVNAKWPDTDCQFCYGNPRCTGFSCITSGYGPETHGAWSNQTEDIHQLCDYAAGRFDIVIWESVQQAFTTGRPLLDYLRDEVFVPKGYRIAHILMNAASFGNVQQRRRYFFVAYRDDRNFNIVPPALPNYLPVLYDALWDLRNRKTNEMVGHEYDCDSYLRLTPDEKKMVPKLPNSWCLNRFAKWSAYDLPARMRNLYRFRTSDMPFSLHCINRSTWLMPSATIHSSSGRTIHPWYHRPHTVGEIATIMGWPDIPRGKQPIPQLAKGVCPAVGQWLAEQAKNYLDGMWGSEDWESRYCDKTGQWIGQSTGGQVEKVFNLTRYTPSLFDIERYPDEVRISRHRFNVDSNTSRLIRPWKQVAESRGRFARSCGVPRLSDEPRPKLSSEPTA